MTRPQSHGRPFAGFALGILFAEGLQMAFLQADYNFSTGKGVALVVIALVGAVDTFDLLRWADFVLRGRRDRRDRRD